MTATLDTTPPGQRVRIDRIAWDRLADDEGRRLREYGLFDGVEVTVLHRGTLVSRDPLALAVGRMRVVIRARQAAAIAVEAVQAVAEREA